MAACLEAPISYTEGDTDLGQRRSFCRREVHERQCSIVCGSSGESPCLRMVSKINGKSRARGLK